MKQPTAMPDQYVTLQQFEIQRVDYSAPEASGRIGGVQAGQALWGAAYTLGRMPDDYSDTWRAWLSGMRGSVRRFLGRDIARTYPKEYPDGFGDFPGFTGAAASWSETINSDDDSRVTLNLGASAAGLILSPGDYIGFSWTATDTSVAGLVWHAVVRVTVGATANGSGSLTVTCEPPLPAAVPNTATAYLNEPKCTMVLVPGQSSLEAIDRLYSIRGGQITAVQDIRE